MGHTVSIANIVSRFAARLEVDSDYVSPTVQTQWANDSIKNLFDHVASVDKWIAAAISPPITVSAGTDLYALPADAVDLLRVEVKETDTDWRPLFGINPSERHLDNLGAPDKLETGFILFGNNIMLCPPPTWSGTMRLFYLPVPPTLINLDISGQATLYSGDLEQWTRTASYVKPNQAKGIGGMPVLEAIIGTASDTSHGVTRAWTLTAATWTISAHARKGAQNFLYLADATVANCWAYFNLNTGAVGNAGAGVIKHSIEDLGDDLYRCSIRLTGTAAAHTLNLYASDADDNAANPAFAGDAATVDLYAGQVQVEQADFPTLFIPSQTSWDFLYGWDEWVILDMMEKFAIREEGETQEIRAAKAEKMALILARAKSRNADTPSRIRDVRAERRAARWPFGRA